MEETIIQLMKDYFGETTEENEEILDIIRQIETETKLQKKVDNIGLFFEIIDSHIEAKKNRLERLKQQIKRLEEKKERFKEFLLKLMEHYGVTELKGNEFKIKIVEGGYKVDAVNLEELPEEFRRVKIDVSVDKEKILDHFRKTGEIPSGVKIEKTRYVKIS